MNMETIIEKYKINGIWHFTDRLNLKLIEEHGGLLPLKVLNDKGINIPVPGGNQWSQDADKRKGVDKYVHLCFLRNHPMQFLAVQEGRIKDPIWLKIDMFAMLAPEVKFTLEVSNKSGAQLLSHSEAVNEIDFEILFTFIDWRGKPEIHERRKAAEKSEILIPDKVPIDKILGYKNG
jgi:ssDNA thymidine ADP-ribosyltransferase, DarT